MIVNVCNCPACPCRSNVEHCAGVCLDCRLGRHQDGETPLSLDLSACRWYRSLIEESCVLAPALMGGRLLPGRREA
jgi:hypothetical protein